MNAPTLNTIIHDDCLNLLPNIPTQSVNFILTDPPYLVGYTSRDGRSIENDDNDKWLKPAFREMFHALAWDTFWPCRNLRAKSADLGIQWFQCVVTHPVRQQSDIA
jgi:hypothetical protein